MDEEFFMDWRVWCVVGILALFICPIFYKQMTQELAMGKVKAIITLIIGVLVSYIPGKIVIEKAA